MAEAVRLQRYLSQCGVAARRKAEELIVGGQVTVNGKRVTTLGSKVVPGRDRVAVDGSPVMPAELFYVLFNKPKGCLTAVSDPEGRPIVMEYLHGLPVAVAPVGRLDFNSEGVLLLTNDGELSARLQSPQSHVEKTYHVKIDGRVGPRQLTALRQGVRLDDGTVTRPAQVDVLSGTKSRHDWLVITLTEGKSRQIHRMLEALGYRVTKLQRVAFAGLAFHGLRVGDARELTQVEVNGLREQAGLPKSTIARGKWSSRREDSELGRRARARARAAGDEGPGRSPSRAGGPPPRGQAGGRTGAARGARSEGEAGRRGAGGSGPRASRSSATGPGGRRSSGSSTRGPSASTRGASAGRAKPGASTPKRGASANTSKRGPSTGRAKPGASTSKRGASASKGKPGVGRGKPATSKGKPGAGRGKPATGRGKPGAGTGKPGAGGKRNSGAGKRGAGSGSKRSSRKGSPGGRGRR
ncbi:pseudouridine synthase [Haliangium sp.]|uniref:pseudouridine synthase n=1 Tax=Haliangium sp. TaxID=2663208 RepID=UPI003D0BF168